MPKEQIVTETVEDCNGYELIARALIVKVAKECSKMKTNQEKSRVIAGKLKLHWHEFVKHHPNAEEWCYGCETNRLVCQDNPDFFKPEGQAVLAGALWENDTLGKNFYITESFLAWLKEQPIHNKNGYHLFHIIAETKLAELFYEFMEQED